MPKGPPRLPPRYPPKKPFIKEQRMHYSDAHAQIAAGKRIPRGTLITGFPELKGIAVSKIKVTFLGTGEIKVPRYKELADGTLKVERYDTVKDASYAIRRSWHVSTGIAEEIQKIDWMFAHIQGFHEALIFEWVDYNTAQRKAAADYTSAIGGIFRFERLSEPRKIKAIERLQKASELLKEGNVRAAAASLIGAANDLVARKNVLLRMNPFVERRGESIAKRKFKEDQEFYAMLDRLIKMDEALTGPKPMLPIGKKNLADRLVDVAKALGKRADKRIQQCAVLASKASGNLRADKVGEAIAAIRLARKNMIDIASESTILYPERLEWVGRHKDINFKRNIVRNQLKFFADNVEYWMSSGAKETPANMRGFLLSVENALTGAQLPEVQAAIKAAADLIREGKIGACAAQIMQILTQTW